MNNICVYLHINPIKQEVFYVGIGNIKKRPYSKRLKSLNNHWHKIVNKYGYQVIIIHKDLSWQRACELEIKYIKQIGRHDKGLGSLTNHTDGGDGSNGYKLTIEQRSNITKALLKRGSPSKKTRSKIRKALKDIPLSEQRKSNISKTLRAKNISKTSDRLLNKKNKNHWHSGTHTALNKPVIQYTLDGKTFAEYPSITEAMIQTNISHINRAISKSKPCCGYIWKFKSN